MISWSRDSAELKQSVKYMKRYAGNEYTFVINRTKTQDRGEYIIRAENHYGWREEPGNKIDLFFFIILTSSETQFY